MAAKTECGLNVEYVSIRVHWVVEIRLPYQGNTCELFLSAEL
jgi:hypothetical protein